MSRIRLGIIGAGLAVRELHLPVLAAMRERFDVVALASRSVESARRLAAELNTTVGRAPTVFATHDELLQSGLCEAVAVAVPITLTPTIVRSALAVGCHVLAEKPLADTVAEHRALIALARSKGVTLMVGEQIRYRRPFHQCHELVTAGLIGRPCVYRLNDMHWTSPEGKYAMTSWRREGRHRGGYLIDGGTHIVAGMRIIVGSPIVDVHGLLASFNPALLGGQPDALLLHLRFANGVVGQMALGYGAVDRESRRPKVYGDAGTLVLFTEHIEIWRPGHDAAMRIPLESGEPGLAEEWSDFHAAVTTGRTPVGTAEEALLDLAVIEAGIRSAEESRCVRMDL